MCFNTLPHAELFWKATKRNITHIMQPILKKVTEHGFGVDVTILHPLNLKRTFYLKYSYF